MIKQTLPLLLLLSSCYRVPDQIYPRVDLAVQDQHLKDLSSPFPPLTPTESREDWGKEWKIGQAFADDLDLYRAVSTFERAEILIPSTEITRKLDIEYEILLCYFLGKKYENAIDSFETGQLAHVDKSFPAYHDLLLVLYECYGETENQDRQDRILELMHETYPETAHQVQISRALRSADLPQIEAYTEEAPYLEPLLDTYYTHKKSVATAQFLNALLPGAGYLYIGQKQSALTAFLLNGLFIAAAYQFFHMGHTAAGIITLSFESGWYFGGIYGAGEEAKYYNEKLYEKTASLTLNSEKLFPILMLEYSF